MLEALATWIFAPSCAACATPSRDPLCAGCVMSLDALGAACPRCAEPQAAPVGVVCRRCMRAPLPLDRIVVPWRFGGELATAIRRLKFTGKTHVARDLAPLWAPVIAAAAAELDAAAIVPVPLHWRRRFARGYDHAWLLARHAHAAAGLRIPLVAALRRIRHAPPQSTLPAAARRDNLRGAFVVRRSAAARIAGRAVVLVDDVVTTGSTLAACARALTAAGATAVVGIALARS
jgi:ComF family protein